MQNFIILLLTLTFLVASTQGLLVQNRIFQSRIAPSIRLFGVPLELTGQLDPSKKWDVKFIYNGEEKMMSVPEDTCFLECGEKLWDDVPSSCRNGVCTTCAGQV
jgi:hypothetical protein